MISCNELSTPENPSSINVPSSAVLLWSLEPRTWYPLPPRFYKIQERAVDVPGIRTMGTNI